MLKVGLIPFSRAGKHPEMGCLHIMTILNINIWVLVLSTKPIQYNAS